MKKDKNDCYEDMNNLRLRKATADDSEFAYQTKKAAFRKYVEKVWGWDEDRQNERAEIVYSLSRQHWGKGLMTEAARAVMNWAFQTYSFNRMFTTCDPRNSRSIRVIEKLGMSREGILRNHLKWNGESRDVMYSSILRHEWLSSRGK